MLSKLHNIYSNLIYYYQNLHCILANRHVLYAKIDDKYIGIMALVTITASSILLASLLFNTYIYIYIICIIIFCVVIETIYKLFIVGKHCRELYIYILIQNFLICTICYADYIIDLWIIVLYGKLIIGFCKSNDKIARVMLIFIICTRDIFFIALLLLLIHTAVNIVIFIIILFIFAYVIIGRFFCRILLELY